MNQNNGSEVKSSTADQTQNSDTNQCSFCLSSITNKSSTDTCGHEFCFECLKQWSEIHNYCPNCRTFYENIKYNMISDTDYKLLSVNNNETKLRQTLISEIHEMKDYLEEMRIRSEQNMEYIKQKLEIELNNNRKITETIARINSIGNQNNATIIQTLNEVNQSSFFSNFDQSFENTDELYEEDSDEDFNEVNQSSFFSNFDESFENTDELYEEDPDEDFIGRPINARYIINSPTISSRSSEPDMQSLSPFVECQMSYENHNELVNNESSFDGENIDSTELCSLSTDSYESFD